MPVKKIYVPELIIGHYHGFRYIESGYIHPRYFALDGVVSEIRDPFISYEEWAALQPRRR